MTDRFQQLKVFISYSRKDLDFAQRLVASLEKRGIAVLIDTRDLPTLRDWRRELLHFLREADAVVFIVSHNSISSPVCAWEIQQVVELNKRLAPVVYERVANDGIPEAITKINYLFFDPPNDFELQADKLAIALQLDLPWVKEHTRLGELARRWNERAHASALQLRGRELEDAERWLSARPKDAPVPTALHQTLIDTSRRAAKVRRRAWVVTLLFAFAAALGAAIYTQFLNLEIDKQRDDALSTQSRFLADLSRQAYADHQTTKATLLALEALPDQRNSPRRPLVDEAAFRLATIVRNYTGKPQRPMETRILFGHSGPVNGALVSPNDKMILTWSYDGTARLWEFSTGALRSNLKSQNSSITTAAFSPDGNLIATGSSEGPITLWDTQSGQRRSILLGLTTPTSALEFSHNGQVLAGATGKTIRLWRLRDGALLAAPPDIDVPITRIKFSSDDANLMAESFERGAQKPEGFSLWSIGSTFSLQKLSIPASRIIAGGFTATGVRFAFVQDGNHLAILDIPSAPRTSPKVRSLSFTVDDGYLAIFDRTTTALMVYYKDTASELWQGSILSGAEFSSSVTMHMFGITSPRVVFGSTSRAIAVISGKVVHVFNSSTGEVADILGGHDDNINDVTFAGNDAVIITTSGSIYASSEVPLLIDDTARVWQVAAAYRAPPWINVEFVTNQSYEPFTADSSRVLVKVVKPSPDGAIGVTVQVWDIRRKLLLGSFSGSHSAGMSISPDGALIFVKSEDGHSRVFDVGSNAEVLRIHDIKPAHSCFSVRGERIIITLVDGTAAVYHVANGVREAIYRLDHGAIRRACFYGKDNLVGTIGGERGRQRLDLWSADKGTIIRREALKSSGAIETSSDMELALIQEDGFSSAIFDVKTGKRRANLKGLAGAPFRAIFSADGKRLFTFNVLSAETWGTIWDVNSGRPIAGIDCDRKGWALAAFTGGGSQVTCINSQGQLLSWSTSDDVRTHIERAKEIAPRCLTVAEREEAFLSPSPPDWCLAQRKWPYNRDKWQNWSGSKSISGKRTIPEIEIDEKHTPQKRARAIIWD